MDDQRTRDPVDMRRRRPSRVARRRTGKPRLHLPDFVSAASFAKVANKLGWSEARLALFKRLSSAYAVEPSISSYLQIRSKFPEVEISIWWFLLPCFTSGSMFMGKLEKLGIANTFIRLIAEQDWDNAEDRIDQVCLRLLECLNVRNNLPAGPRYIEQRLAAISDALMNYVIVTILELMTWSPHTLRIPSSFMLLIRQQLCGGMRTDLFESHKSQTRKTLAAAKAACGLEWSQVRKTLPAAAAACSPEFGERLTVHKLMAIADLGQGTAARYLKDPEFRRELEESRKLWARYFRSTSLEELEQALIDENRKLWAGYFRSPTPKEFQKNLEQQKVAAGFLSVAVAAERAAESLLKDPQYRKRLGAHL